jgi:hypothetical protein
MVAEHGDAFGDVHRVVLQVVDVAARAFVDQLRLGLVFMRPASSRVGVVLARPR